MWPLVLGQKPLKCQEKPSGVYKMQQTTGAAGAPPQTPLGALTALPQIPYLVGRGWLWLTLPQKPTLLSAFQASGFGPLASPLPAPNFQTASEVKSYIRPCYTLFSVFLSVSHKFVTEKRPSGRKFIFDA